jgi:hypothetical protein
MQIEKSSSTPACASQWPPTSLGSELIPSREVWCSGCDTELKAGFAPQWDQGLPGQHSDIYVTNFQEPCVHSSLTGLLQLCVLLDNGIPWCCYADIWHVLVLWLSILWMYRLTEMSSLHARGSSLQVFPALLPVLPQQQARQELPQLCQSFRRVNPRWCHDKGFSDWSHCILRGPAPSSLQQPRCQCPGAIFWLGGGHFLPSSALYNWDQNVQGWIGMKFMTFPRTMNLGSTFWYRGSNPC